ncbi:hypothetical protein LZ496_01235 [Sphingomonas sp. NSE70-1]|uniref:Uncharacterized protein n=1 Tax=Sphingomonas caseinilyticus TaxID=2908205 RepID=A0ABT0RQY8_9SPHN|nr:hypothetical protein [Sphingomonas caseinilyticus]MCL6697414.1 hypothetical protein [Sphingomonas caseinilyticus]
MMQETPNTAPPETPAQPSEPAQPGQPAQPTVPPAEAPPIAPDVDIPAPGTTRTGANDG